MRYVFLSPHLDDAVFSCANFIAGLRRKGKQVVVVSIFTRFGTLPISRASTKYLKLSGAGDLKAFEQQRQNEDKQAMRKLGCEFRHLGFIDGGFRKTKKTGSVDNIFWTLGLSSPYLYPTRDVLFGGVPVVEDEELLILIRKKIDQVIEPRDCLFFPLGVGGHVDHIIVNRLSNDFKQTHYYWLDYPYALVDSAWPSPKIDTLHTHVYKVSPTRTKQEVIDLYASQVPDKYTLEKMLSSREQILATSKEPSVF